MFGPIKNIVFDFDGTLVDTMGRVAEGLQKAVEHGSGKLIPIPDLVATFGPAPRGVLEKWVDADQVEKALAFWLQYESESTAEQMKIFPGVLEMLEALKAQDVWIAVFTGRDRASTLKILKVHGWLDKFFTEDRVVCGDDGFAPKPSGEALLHLIKKFSLNPHETLMVGDHVHDAKAGRSAGCKTAAALWDTLFQAGPTERSRFKANWTRWDGHDCDLRLTTPSSLSAWLRG